MIKINEKNMFNTGFITKRKNKSKRPKITAFLIEFLKNSG